MTYLEFEKPVAELQEQLDKLRLIGEQGKVDVTASVAEMEEKIGELRKNIYENLNAWQRVQLSRHPDRPYTLYYIENLCENFVELHGDRAVGDDKAIVGGFGLMDGQTYLFLGQQKGVNTKMRQYRRFGMANPEGYRKALRLMKLAEKFNKPIVTFIDTPGAFPGIEAEERGQAEAIARNLFEMTLLKVPVICIVLGEGASGGAIGIGLGDRIFMLENTWYSVISPEGCASILWRSADFKEQAAEALQLTAKNNFELGIIDGIIKEPLGGAHVNPKSMVTNLKRAIKKNIKELSAMDPEERIQARIDKYSAMGRFTEVSK
ncbi:MAG: acetyl-CoA carboxylase carboxyltransferase subunit alpha [Bacteroidetes bacterium]|nr:acetyl-CoA carboxylase carboxyltransferase subunit alpha [Bacteroidota bacterium]